MNGRRSRELALIGDPVAHSVSPAMHRAAFAAAGLDLDYRAMRVPAAELPSIWPELRRTFLGLNVTAPLKELVAPLLDQVSPVAELAGSVNTVSFDEEGRARGDSTDGAGFLSALDRAGPVNRASAVILGTGGAARAVVGALLERGFDVTVSGRNRAAGERLTRLGAAFVPRDQLAWLLREAGVLVNATPLGSGPYEGVSPLPAGVPLRPGLVVVDLVYRPRRTALLRQAAAAGCRTAAGVEMLVEQGGRSFEIWTGQAAPLKVMRTAAYQALAQSMDRSDAVEHVGEVAPASAGGER